MTSPALHLVDVSTSHLLIFQASTFEYKAPIATYGQLFK